MIEYLCNILRYCTYSALKFNFDVWPRYSLNYNSKFRTNIQSMFTSHFETN